MSKHHIIKTKKGYIAVVEGGQTKEITSKKDVAEIKRLLKIRRDAGVELSKLIRGRGLTTAMMFQATRTLGE
ncbi:MAG TPA: hypothetical protein VFQ83_01140 [Candidatus Udaeobacter sp.]|nr:hypothetical protein [Candidatus Udaeobacter sp.]